MTPVPGAEDDGFWYEEEIDKLVTPRAGFIVFNAQWTHWSIFPTSRDAYAAAKNGDRTAQRLLKESYERYIVTKLTG